jgi:hypothetical protein
MKAIPSRYGWRANRWNYPDSSSPGPAFVIRHALRKFTTDEMDILSLEERK